MVEVVIMVKGFSRWVKLETNAKKAGDWPQCCPEHWERWVQSWHDIRKLRVEHPNHEGQLGIYIYVYINIYSLISLTWSCLGNFLASSHSVSWKDKR